MAYKTSHRITTLNKVSNDLRNEIEEHLSNNEDISWITYGELNEWGDEDRSFSDKYDNMKELSEKFPDVVFILDYEPISDYSFGEYREYWSNGKVQNVVAEITIESFDEDKLMDDYS